MHERARYLGTWILLGPHNNRKLAFQKEPFKILRRSCQPLASSDTRPFKPFKQTSLMMSRRGDRPLASCFDWAHKASLCASKHIGPAMLRPTSCPHILVLSHTASATGTPRSLSTAPQAQAGWQSPQHVGPTDIGRVDVLHHI